MKDDNITVNQYLELKHKLLLKVIGDSSNELKVVSELLLNYFSAMNTDIAKFSMELDYNDNGETKTRKITFIAMEE